MGKGIKLKLGNRDYLPDILKTLDEAGKYLFFHCHDNPWAIYAEQALKEFKDTLSSEDGKYLVIKDLELLGNVSAYFERRGIHRLWNENFSYFEKDDLFRVSQLIEIIKNAIIKARKEERRSKQC